MSTEMEKLHARARRYCMERHTHWANAYSKIAAQGKERKPDGYNYTDEALNIFPRYHVLSAILVELERLIPQSFATPDEAKELMCLAGKTAESVFTESPHSDIQIRAMDEEREAFCRYIINVAEDELVKIEPLFYRRVLSAVEEQEIWSRIKLVWGTDGWYWYPLIEGTRDDVLAMQENYFYEEVGAEKLREILAGNGVARVWELRESKSEPAYEMELSIFEPCYNGLEGYWCSEKMDWLIYASHESSITFGGAWLTEKLKGLWPEWTSRVWVSPYFE